MTKSTIFYFIRSIINHVGWLLGSQAPLKPRGILPWRGVGEGSSTRSFTLSEASSPNITNLDKASIIKDAIDYVQQLQEQERTVLAELSQLESLREKKASLGELEFDDLPFLQRKKKRTAPGSPSSSPIEVVELRVREMDKKTMVVSITCTKKRDTMTKVCELFESLDLKFITANITNVSGSLFFTLFVEV
ncbi:hypothetical protein BHM03_00021229 [Ensete ventricosum]|nr:hypothetical protein BHM03_00021229 [Ensete ventricosum]